MPSPLAALLLSLLALSPTDPTFPGDVHSTPTGPVWVDMAFVGAEKPHEGIGRGVIEAPPERVWRALTDYAHWHEFMPFLEKSGAQPQPDGSVLSDHALALPLGELHYKVRFIHTVEPIPEGKVWRIRWAAVPGSGNVTDHRGSWTLTALEPGRTLAVCHLYTEAAAAPPGVMDRGTANMLAWIFHGLRQHVRRARYDAGGR